MEEGFVLPCLGRPTGPVWTRSHTKSDSETLHEPTEQLLFVEKTSH